MLIALEIFFAAVVVLASGFFGYVAVAEVRRHRSKKVPLKSSIPLGKDLTLWGIWSSIVVVLEISNVQFIEPVQVKFLLLAVTPALIVVAVQVARLRSQRADAVILFAGPSGRE